jgi:hypothetical protein
MDGFGHGQLADCGTSLPPQDAATTDRRKPRLFARSVKWPKVRDDFGHGQLEHVDLILSGTRIVARPELADLASPSGRGRPQAG